MKNKMFLIALVVLGVFFAVFIYLKDEFKEIPPSNQNTMQATEEAVPFSVVPTETSILVKNHAPTKGAFGAKITLVEFLDPECEACSAMSPIVQKIYEEHKSDIQIVVRYMTYHKNSKYVANILEGARLENKYWEALELLFQTQSQWADHHNPQPELIPEILKPLKLNMKKIISDAQAGKYDKQILEDFEDGKKIGVRGTPTFFINGHQIQELGYESLKNEIEARLNQN
jgi:protein-disulfide isomerase